MVVHDPYTLDVVTAEPDALVLSKLASTGCSVMSKAYFEEVGYQGGPRIVLHGSDLYVADEDAARITDAMLQEIGFDVDLRILDWANYRDTISHPRRQQDVALKN
ncbi:MAG: hypothetical protein WD535_01550 [Thermaerobacterales bacterium]